MNAILSGQRPDGAQRFIVYDEDLFHASKHAEAIRGGGFDPGKRNPVLLGFSAVAERYSHCYDGLFNDKSKVVRFRLHGQVWDVSDDETSQLQALMGHSADPVWNALVKKVALAVGLDWNVNDHEARVRFAEAVRVSLLHHGIAGVQLGAETQVVDIGAIIIQEAKP